MTFDSIASPTGQAYLLGVQREAPQVLHETLSMTPWGYSFDRRERVTLYHVAVLLSQEGIYARPGDGYEPLSGHVKAIEFIVDATSPTAACEVAYGVTNSFTNELHCPANYREVVETYRDIGGFRSVSVDDIFEVDGQRFVCARFGFARVSV